MAFSILGLQAAVTEGNEPTFDGQKMQAGTHLRWAFAPELGFPPGGFWLLRRLATQGETSVPPPRGSEPPPPPNEGCGDPKDCRQGKPSRSCRRCTSCGGECRCRCECNAQHCCDEGCKQPEPGGPGWGVSGGEGGWGPPDQEGWQLWGQPFTLPVTRINWPARYAGALDPSTHSDAILKQRDILECGQRLTGLSLLNGMSAAEQQGHFSDLRDECVRLVQGWPSELSYAVLLQASTDGAHAPDLGLHLVEQLQLSSLNPYMARVLGLYFVDTHTALKAVYDYCIVGVWLGTPAAPRAYLPGVAPRAGLAQGNAQFSGLTITADNTAGHLFSWARDDAKGNYAPAADPSSPAEVVAAFNAAISGVAQGAQPGAMLAAQVNPAVFPFPPAPSNPLVCDMKLARPGASVDLAIAGVGVLIALSAGNVVASRGFATNPLQTVTLQSTDPVNAPIDEIQVQGLGGFSSVVVIGAVSVNVIIGSYIGTRFALVHAPGKIVPPVQPPVPVSIFRKREAILAAGPKLVVQSSMDVQWVATPATAADQTGNPTTNPIALPPPTRAVAFVAEQADADPTTPIRLPQIILSAPQPTPKGSPLLPAPLCLRFRASSLPDPVKGYEFRVAGFNAFGELGAWSGWSAARGVEYIAGAPTTLRLTNFGNSAAYGGHPDAPANPTAWIGGRVAATAQWSGSALLMYPDTRSARLTAMTADGVTTLAQTDFVVPAPTLGTYVVSDIVPDPARGTVYVITAPALPEIGDSDPAASLTLTGTLDDGISVSERYAVRPGPCDPTADVQVPGIVATIAAGAAARIVANPGLFIGQPAYLVRGVAVSITLDVPLSVPIANTTARGVATVTSSRASPFDPNEQIIDPNGLNLPRNEPASAPIYYTGAQYLQPPLPPVPMHSVHHVYYDPADYYGDASRDLGFDTSAGSPAISGYVLERANVHSLSLADVKRRRTVGLTDNNPAIAGRPDLAAWIAVLPQWLAAYNARTGAGVTTASLFDNADAVRAFIAHFYGGLLDDELRALGDVAANSVAFARTNTAPLPQNSAVVDIVNGSGYGRNLYKLSGVNQAGSTSGRTGSVGPIYTRIVTVPRAPVLYKVQPAAGALIVAWALTESTDIAGYLIYRAADPTGLSDLRYFGPDPTHPQPRASLAQPAFSPKVWHGLTLGPGAVDPRLIGVVNDPRVFARDYDNSDMAEIPLPTGRAPDEVLGIYRLSEFNPATPRAQPGAFNYWTPLAVGGISQIVVDGATQSRLTGLRLGLGQGVAAVVVARWGSSVRAVGSVDVRRAAFVDGVIAGTANSADPNALPSWTPPASGTQETYAVVAVDIWGNVSMPSKTFSAQTPKAA
jgi:hypothetical protein